MPAHCFSRWRSGVPGETYNIGGKNERTNLQVVETICSQLDRALPPRAAGPAAG